MVDLQPPAGLVASRAADHVLAPQGDALCPSGNGWQCRLLNAQDTEGHLLEVGMWCQRWKLRRGLYRPAGEVIDTRRHEVALIPGDTEARAFVEAHHYSGSYPAARVRVGLYRGGELVGVAVFSQPVSAGVLAGFPSPGVELGRFVLLDEVPGNGETWFLARCFELLRAAGFASVVSFSDPVPRTTAQGLTVFPGHMGTIYQAHNARYLGRSTPRTLRLLPDGTVFSDRAAQKVRALERGHVYAEALLTRWGAQPRGDSNPREWLAYWLPRLTRPLRHAGNLRYVWGLTPSAKRSLPAGMPYLKPMFWQSPPQS